MLKLLKLSLATVPIQSMDGNSGKKTVFLLEQFQPKQYTDPEDSLK